ncbi:histidine phosphatase family protein [Pseudalkalibacillus hwajinpoensis]|uniref:histidine phosphatase family protein n=1 Tax=Guptibacillus hwajinpoensis TaxID=208199 RepID=UPI001CD77469|nr:histidine phosphatase family protein [Pseudalkalibacillus hwajinpoensis]MCA0990528.1 histidine phosphatase family protein [Pseudalkalibacillus hwajinpoensis]
MRIGFIRHGSTSWNKEKRAQGSSDIHLDEQGRRDAAKLGESLLNEEWDIIVSSDLSRAKETAEIIGRSLHIDVKTDPRLREAGGGQIEGTTEQERIEKWGEKWRELDLGIEKEELVVARAHEALDDLYHQYPGQNILIVSHGSFLRHFFKSTLPELNHEKHIVNTSLTVLRRKGDEWLNELYHSTSHLD